MKTPKVHYDTGGRPRCGSSGTTPLTTDRDAVTCVTCADILDGRQGNVGGRIRGYEWADHKPHGTPAAARRHYRRGERLCESCNQAEARRQADRRNRKDLAA